MSKPIELTPDEHRCLKLLAAGGPVDRMCRETVLERLREKGLVAITVQTLPMFPLGRHYRLTPLGEQIARSLP